MDNALLSIESPSPSILTALRPPSTPTPSRRADSRWINGVEWLRTGHQANHRRGIQSSGIWLYGDEYIKLAEPDKAPCWVCDLCDAVRTMPSGGGTSNMVQHLKKDHGILLKRTRNDRESEDSPTTSSSIGIHTETPVRTPRFSALVTRLDIDRHRGLLIRWIVTQQIPYSAVEQPEFRDWLLYIQPSLEAYLPKSHNTIKGWVDSEYQKAKEAVKERLADTISRIHLSFDIWTSLSGLPILGICAHFLTPTLQLCHPLLATRQIEGSHTGEGIAEVIAAVVKEFEILPNKLGVYVADNASNCDRACKELVYRLHEGKEDEGSRRSRCLGHIINLAAQAFIYGEKNEAFIN